MDTWIKADYFFGEPWVVFTVPYSRALAIELRDTVQRWRDDPREMEGAVLALVALHRPDIAGGAVTSIRFEVCSQRWEICYVHSALPRVKSCGTIPETVPLIPEQGLVDPLAEAVQPDVRVEGR